MPASARQAFLGRGCRDISPFPAFAAVPTSARLLVLLTAMLLCALLGLVIEQAAYRPLRTRSWIIPGIVIGGASGYVAYGIAINGNRTPASAIAIGIIVWIALAALLRTTQSRRAIGNAIAADGTDHCDWRVAVFRKLRPAAPDILIRPALYPDQTRSCTLPNRVSLLGSVSLSVQTLLIFGLSLVLMALADLYRHLHPHRQGGPGGLV